MLTFAAHLYILFLRLLAHGKDSKANAVKGKSPRYSVLLELTTLVGTGILKLAIAGSSPD